MKMPHGRCEKMFCQDLSGQRKEDEKKGFIGGLKTSGRKAIKEMVRGTHAEWLFETISSSGMSMKNKNFILFMTLLTVFILDGCRKRIVTPEAAVPFVPGKIIYAGVRSSSYGVKPFPQAEDWQSAMQTMSGYFTGATPCAIWIVGEFKEPKTCRLFFPSEGKVYPFIQFEETDRHEQFLSHFDRVGIKVFLQVEPGHADMITLIDLVLNRYKHHDCLAGFGVDVEWHREADNPETGVPVDDRTAKEWEARVKSHNRSFQLFLKHWDRKWMPKKYRGDIIFVDDSQMLEDFDAMLKEFANYWAKHFKPNTVFFQVGYKSDRLWWQKLDNPPEKIGKAIARRIKQKCGIFWVDFTLRDIFLLSSEQLLPLRY